MEGHAVRFRAPVLALEGVPTDDGRQFRALDWRDLPLTLYAALTNSHGHDGAPIAGSIDEITRTDGGVLEAVIDTDDDGWDGMEAARLIQRQDLRGISIDAIPQGEVRDVVGPDGDIVGVEFEAATIMAATLTGQPAFADANQIDPTPLDDPAPEEPSDGDGPPESQTFAAAEVVGDVGLPVAGRDVEWDGDGAAQRVLEFCTDVDDVDAECVGRAFLWRDPDEDGTAADHYRLGFADVIDGELTIVPAGVAATAGGRGVDAADIPDDDKQQVKMRICGLYDTVSEAHEDWPDCPFASDDSDDMDEPEEEQAAARRCAATAATTGQRCKRQAADGAVTCAAHGALPSLTVVTTDCQGCEALTAAGVRIDDGLNPDWFTDPQLDGPTPVTVADDGRIFGHLASWKTCHTAFSGVCITPPKSRSSYAYFTTGEVRAAGRTIPVGQITMDTDHADEHGLSAAGAKAHYDNTGSAVADVTAGEDAHGIWIAGAVRPDVMQDQDRLRRLRAATLSGDWRRIGGQLDLVAALCVNVPGFPVPRSLAASGWMVEGVQTSLVAAGLVSVREPEATEDVVRRVIREERDRERLLAQADLAVQPSRDAVLARLDQTVGV